MRAVIGLIAFLLISVSASAAGIDDLSNKDRVAGLKQALIQGSGAAVSKLGVVDGFLGNPKVKIPLPETLQKVEGLMRSFGMGKQADELVTTMNRAAEAAVPEAKALLIDAVKKMTVEDARPFSPAATTRPRNISKRPPPVPLPRNSCRSSKRPPTRSGSRRNITILPPRARSSAW